MDLSIRQDTTIKLVTKSQLKLIEAQIIIKSEDLNLSKSWNEKVCQKYSQLMDVNML